MTRRAAWQAALMIARLIVVFGLIAAVLSNLGRIRRARAILLYPGGGFGHTVSGPDWLRRLHPEGPNLTFFGTYPRGHNRLIANIWGQDAIVWVQTGFRLPGGQPVTDVAWSYRLFGILDALIRRFAPRKPATINSRRWWRRRRQRPARCPAACSLAAMRADTTI